jgi:murein DD-endopeptidase MepM/ murein hydrolase activator NlpD
MGVMSIAAQDVTHIIQKGETIYSIARSYGVKQQDILSLNGIRDPRRIQTGQRLRIPLQETGVRTGGDFAEYQVSKGETLYGIARRYGTTVDSIRQVNNFADTYVLKEGDLLKIPPAGIASGSVPKTDPGKGAGTEGRSAEAGANVPETGPAKIVPAANPGTETLGTETAGTRDEKTGGPAPAAPRFTVTGKVDPSIRWPISAKEVMYMTGKLYGVVLLGEQRESVKSLTQGTVVSAGPYRGFGKVAIVQMTGGYLYVYGGCESLSVKEGDRVVPGTEVGKLGIDAVSVKPQLFFLVYRSNAPIDPAKAPRA